MKIALTRGKWVFNNGMTFDYGIFPSCAKSKGNPCCFYFTNEILQSDTTMLKNTHFATPITIRNEQSQQTDHFKLDLYEDILSCTVCHQNNICNQSISIVTCPNCSENSDFHILHNPTRLIYTTLGIIITDIIEFSYSN